MDELIAEDHLYIDHALLARLEDQAQSVRWHDLNEDVRQAYARYIVLLDSELRRELGVVEMTEPVAFYNAYHWALMFAKLYRAQHGFNAGVEQEVFKLLERAPATVDWQVVEQIAQEVQRA